MPNSSPENPGPRAFGDPIVDSLRLHLATLYQAGLARALVERFQNAEGVLRSPKAALLQVPGLKKPVLERLFAPATLAWAKDEASRARDAGVEILAWGSAHWPAPLDELPQMPILLYARGRVAPFPADPGSVGVIGSRRATPYGLAQARRFSEELARRGLVIVSGLALGVDGEAHRAALDVGGATIGVLGSGLHRMYPPEHRELADRMISSGRGLLLSELPLEAAPKSFHFPMRNRLLSGLSRAILVIEAGEKSGSLITVTHALEQGKHVYALPGRVDRPESMGCLRLLMDGASPVLSPEDVLPGTASPPAPRSLPLDRVERKRLPGKLGAKLDLLFAEEDSWSADTIAERLETSPGVILAELCRLELDGFLRRLPGGFFAKT